MLQMKYRYDREIDRCQRYDRFTSFPIQDFLVFFFKFTLILADKAVVLQSKPPSPNFFSIKKLD